MILPSDKSKPYKKSPSSSAQYTQLNQNTTTSTKNWDQNKSHSNNQVKRNRPLVTKIQILKGILRTKYKTRKSYQIIAVNGQSKQDITSLSQLNSLHKKQKAKDTPQTSDTEVSEEHHHHHQETLNSPFRMNETQNSDDEE